VRSISSPGTRRAGSLSSSQRRPRRAQHPGAGAARPAGGGFGTSAREPPPADRELAPAVPPSARACPGAASLAVDAGGRRGRGLTLAGFAAMLPIPTSACRRRRIRCLPITGTWSRVRSDHRIVEDLQQQFQKLPKVLARYILLNPQDDQVLLP